MRAALDSVAERASSQSPARSRPHDARALAAAVARGGATPAQALALQRVAGNRATRAALGPPASGRTLARCGGGVCTCGGRCHQDELLEEDR
jgi:hypothetical protein